MKGGIVIDVIVHTPKSTADQELLRQKVAEIHAVAILSRIEKLSCPKEQKLKLLATVKKAAT